MLLKLKQDKDLLVNKVNTDPNQMLKEHEAMAKREKELKL